MNLHQISVDSINSFHHKLKTKLQFEKTTGEIMKQVHLRSQYNKAH